MDIAQGELIESVCQWLQHAAREISSDVLVEAVANASEQELASLLGVLIAQFEQLSTSPHRLRILMQQIASRRLASGAQTGTVFAPDAIEQLYDRLSEVDGQAAAHALQILAAQGVTGEGDEESIDSLASILLDAPPTNWQHAALAVSPLWNARREQLEFFFDRLQDGGVQPSTMAVLLDLANFAFRKQQLAHHPWEAKQAELGVLLGGLVARLEKLEKNPSQFGNSVEDVQRVLADSIALTVAVCDALGLIGASPAKGVLSTAMGLSHRRIQTEAAAALARIGDARGRKRLIELAEDTVARRRAVAYAEELGFVDDIDESLRFPAALAESELAAWLTAPSQFGIPPDAMKLIDVRTQFWPGYDDPQDCFLFRYDYQLPTGVVSNIGIAGPVSHAFQSNLVDLPVDDIYAAFAGWQAEHEEIFEVPATLLNASQRREADRLMDFFGELGFTTVECIALTFLLGETALLAKLDQEGQQYWGITDGIESLRFPATDRPTSISAEVVLAIFRGRKLLRSFND